jgi:choline kinase
MEAIMLAAGTGSRLTKKNDNYPPKCLLRFDGRSLLERHIDILKFYKISKLTLIIGYRSEDIITELAKIDKTGFVQTVINPKYQEGTIASLSCATDVMRSGVEILFMDADVLYHPDLIERLALSGQTSHIPFDTEFEPGDEPVMLCLNQGKIIEFRKNTSIMCDNIGEWPGFVKWSPHAAQQIANIVERRIMQGFLAQPCEAAFREYMLSSGPENIYCDNITGLPWIEIDFPEDIERARNLILPAIESYTR